jgi:two-component system, chemotaxis family, protein-glutamate methylesterase/glutaminase
MPTRGHDIVVIGASAGGVETLERLFRALPADLPAAIFVVVHLPRHYPSHLAEILSRSGPLPAETAIDNTLFQKGRVYVAPPDYHVLLEPNRMRVVHGPMENRHRPAIDPLFRSAAWALGPRVTAVVLSGTLDDGAAGLWAVKSTGGTTVVQDPAEAKFSGMPTSALLYSTVDHCLRLDEIAPLLNRLAREPVGGEARTPETVGEEVPMAAGGNEGMDHLDRIGELSAFTCPACGGALWEMENRDVLRFRCHVGHAFNGDSLVDAQSDAVERAVYTAMRALREQAEVVRRVASGHTDESSRTRYDRRARELDEAAVVLKELLLNGKT